MSKFDDLMKFSRRKAREERLVSPRKFNTFLMPYKKKAASGHPIQNQRTVVKVFYNKARARSEHDRYISRDGAGLNGSKPDLFTAENRQPEQGKLPNEVNFFKATISPENPVSNLVDYTRDVMAEAEKTLGHDLKWYAAAHHNTAHPHVHVVIRGEHDGKELRLDPRFISTSLRDIASDRSTMELGLRSQREIQHQQQRDLKAERLTAVDYKIGKIEKESKKLNLPILPSTPQQHERLNNLSVMGYAVKSSNGFTMADNWQKRLKWEGQKGDILKSMHSSNKSQPGLFFRYDKSMSISGEVVHKDVEESGRFVPYAMVKTQDNKLYYVKGSNTNNLKLGDYVSVSNGNIQELSQVVRRNISKGAVL